MQALSAAPSQIYASFWKRLVAVFIDAAIITVGTGLLITITFGGGAVFGIVVHWLYEAGMISSQSRATVGKRLLGIVVTDTNGERISFARASGRHFAKYLSAFLLFVGYIIAAFTTKKQALHDLIAETVVLHGR
jgi:uncharacterized RDD family membrane protein YckC